MAKEEDIEFQDTKHVELLDYVKKKRRWAFVWGFGAASILVGISFAIADMPPTTFPRPHKHIAQVKIENVIFEDEYRSEMLREISERDDVKAMIISINSPGGYVYPSEVLYKQLRKISEKIPTVTLQRNVAASGAYMASISSDHIIAGETTVTGSIGVITEIPNISDLLDKVGIETTLIRSSEAKGGISPTRDPTPEEIADEEALIGGMYNSFKKMVGERRGLSGADLDKVTKGEVFTGEQAIKLKLVDEIGGYDEALEYLKSQDEDLEKLDVVTWEPLYPEADTEYYIGALSKSLKSELENIAIESKIPNFQAILR